jgi:tRNA nucleotidyltransferase (CCA-adding enzyme)
MIAKAFDLKLIALLKEIESIGIKLCLVGGAPRDFYLSQTISKDLDFEIRCSFADKENWSSYFLNLVNLIKSKKLKYEIFPYQILKVEFSDYSLEFSSPRVEYFQLNKHAHHNFEALLDPKLSYVESFKRRDFTINAIGVELNFSGDNIVENICDPYDGIEDLKARVLKNIDDDFFKDSVRFLRMIRFSIKLGFEVSPNLLKNIKRFNLSELSKFHFFSEMFKTDAASFLNLFSKYIKMYSMDLPEEYNFLKDLDWPTGKLKTKEHFLVWSILYKPELVEDIQSFFNLPKKSAEKMRSFFNSFLFLSKLKDEDIKKLLKLSFDEILSSEILKNLKNFDDKIEFKEMFAFFEKFKLGISIDMDDLSLIKITNEEFERIKPEQRSLYKYYIFLKTNYE